MEVIIPNMDKKYIVDESIRLDKFLSSKLEVSRNQIEQLIKKEFVKVDGKTICKSGQKLKLNQTITIQEISLETIPLTFSEEELSKIDVKIIYEDDYFLVILKPEGLTVHSAPSVKEPTLVDWLKYKNISLSTISGEERHGIVHRLDKGTTGLMVVAKTNESHTALASQLEDKSMGRYYIALIDLPLKEDIIVDKPIARNPSNRLKMGIVNNGKNAKTAFKKLILPKETSDKKYELISAKLFTGRTHQIRVHLESIGRHILGDDLYGFKSKSANIKRIYLHAYCLYLKHPISNESLEFISPLPDEFKQILNNEFDKDEIDEILTKEHISSSFTSLDGWLQSISKPKYTNNTKD
jgi:23S rRNA pseudouridine1911/1915/1917 synthase